MTEEGIVPFQGLAKQQLLKRCRELEFVDDVEDLKCTRCNRLALEHWYTNCGHALCPNCKRLLSGGGFKCPQCGQLIQHIKEESADFEEKVKEFQAKCPNSKYGCPLVTTVKQLQEHVVGCEWTKEQVLPAVYRGTSTTQMLLEEVSSLKEQMGEMRGTIEFLSNELNERLKAEAAFKKSVEMSVEDIESHLNKLASDLHHETTTLKVQFKDFDQIKMTELQDLKNTLTFDINNKIKALEKSFNEINFDKFKDNFVSKEELKQLQKTTDETNGNNQLFMEMLDQKEDRFNQQLTEEIMVLDAKILKSEGKMKATITNCRQETLSISKDLKKQLDDVTAKATQVEKHVKKRVGISTEDFNNHFQQLSTKVHDELTQMSHYMENQTEKLKEEVDQLNIKTGEIEKSIDGISNCLIENYKTKVEAIQQLNPQMNPIEAFQRGITIEQLLNRNSSICHLVESFLYGSTKEKMAFESLCLKWTIKHKDIFIAEEDKGEHEHLSDIFPVYRFQLMAQLRLAIKSDGYIKLQLCFKDEERKGQEVNVKCLPMVTFIIKDLSGNHKSIIRYDHCPFNKSFQYNEFDYLSVSISKSEWNALISPGDELLKVLVLVEPPTIINNPLSVEGAIRDTIQHFSWRLQMAKAGLIKSYWSPPFLTHAGGYRVAVKMCLNEPIGNNPSGLTAEIWFLSGEFDSQLGVEFEHETNIMLINKYNAMSNVIVKKRAELIHVYTIKVAGWDEIGSRGFLLNDSLTYCVTIKPITKK